MIARLYQLVRFLLLLAVLPLVTVVATTGQAQAVTAYGGRVDWGFQDGNAKGAGGAEGFGTTKANCTGTAFWVADEIAGQPAQVRVRGGYDCDIAVPWDDDPNALTNTATTIYLAGAFVDTGDPCTYFASSTADPLGGLTYETDANNAGCLVERVCAESVGTWDRDVFSDQTYTWDGCASVNLGAQPEPETGGSCVAGMPTFARSWSSPSEYGGEMVYRQTDITFVLDQAMGHHTDWAWEARFPVAGTSGPVPDVNRGAFHNGFTNASQGYGTWAGTEWKSSKNLQFGLGEPVGIWVWAQGVQGNVRSHSSYTYGQNDPANCHFYFGPKFYDDPSSTLDDPAGPMGEPIGGSDTPPSTTPTAPVSDPQGEDCQFTLTDPSSWATAGMCAAVGILKLIWDTLGDILGAITGLAGDIARAILDGIEGLFIPEDGVFQDEMDKLAAVWGDTSLHNYLDAFTDLRPGSMDGCSGLPLRVDLGGGVTVDEHIGAACSGSMATAANMVHMALQVVIIVGGVMACLRGIGSGLNWSPGVGRVDG